MATVAVYGTLKQGHGNHRILGKDATYIGSYWLQGYDMYHLGGYPGIVRGSGSVLVELYHSANLESLDYLEANGRMYQRELVDVDGHEAWVYVYLYSVEGRSVIESGVW